ncbi:MAG TPA: T9SS type A sorting domain-containing protein [Flavobacteriaceae bacterium]|nr:T9SS type A sorting domain-containing protein [Flavobacteriaceae bacterium]
MKRITLRNAPNHIFTATNSYGLILLFMIFALSFANAQNDHANENATVDGGTVSTTDNTSICLGDENPDVVNVTVDGASGRVKQLLVTDDTDDPLILMLPESWAVNFSDLEPGNYRIYNLAYNGIKPLVEPFWHKHVKNLSDILGRFDLSDEYIDVIVQQKPTGGTLEGGPFEFCVGDGIADNIPEGSITLSGNMGTNSQWVVTNQDGSTILALPNNYTDVDFDGAPAGTCLVWHLMYEDGLTGLEVDAATEDLMGCFEFSNSVTVIRRHTEGGTLEGGPFEFCVGDGETDNIPEGAITLSGNEGTNSQWVVTNEDGTNIMGLPENSYTEVNFDEAPAGICLVWHLSYEDGLEGLEVGNDLADLMGCFDLSNSVTVIRIHTEGGTLEGGPFEFTVGDGEADTIPEDGITLSDNVGTNSQWVVTNEDGTTILALPENSYTEVDFDGTDAGTNLVWHLSYEDGLDGLEVDAPVSDLSGCFSFSNSVSVVKTAASSGRIALYPNPTKDEVNLDLSHFYSDEFKVRIFNLLNVNMFNQSYTSRTLNGNKNIAINVLGYQQGLYFIQVTDDNTEKVYIKRLLIK